MDELQTPEELLAHYGPAGPVEAAQTWAEITLERGLLEVTWSRMDDNLRAYLAQEFVFATRVDDRLAPSDPQAAVRSLGGPFPEHYLWPYCQTACLKILRDWWPNFIPSTWGALSRPRPVGPDLELVIFVPDGGPAIHAEPTLISEYVSLLMRSTDDGWLLAGWTETPPTPRSSNEAAE